MKFEPVYLCHIQHIPQYFSTMLSDWIDFDIFGMALWLNKYYWTQSQISILRSCHKLCKNREISAIFSKFLFSTTYDLFFYPKFMIQIYLNHFRIIYFEYFWIFRIEFPTFFHSWTFTFGIFIANSDIDNCLILFFDWFDI